MTTAATEPRISTSILPHVAAAIADFDRDGFVLIESMLDADALSAIHVGVEWMMNHAPGSAKWIRPFTYEFHRQFPIFVELIEHPFVIDFARQTLGDDFHVIAAQCSRNPRDDHYCPGAAKIHQDDCFIPPSLAHERRHLGFSAMWICQDTPLEMGPTELIPRSHTVGGRTYHNDALTASDLWRRPLPAGSLLIFSHRCWHRGAQNLTDTPRDLITNAYAIRAVDKVQLLKRQPDGTEAYVPPTDLLATASPMIRQLLSA